MADLASFWVGDRLGPIEIASARSFLRHGDSLTIFSPAPVGDVPAGVILRDASDIMPTDRIIRHRKTGSPALHSDLFRYALMARTDMIWVDLDVIARQSLDGLGPWIFGYETETEVNGAVLRLPRDSATLDSLRGFTADTVGLPPMMKGLRRFRYWLKSGGRGMGIDRWPWGAIGPRALTHYLIETGEIRHAMPRDSFYHVGLDQVDRFLKPGDLTDADLPDGVIALHLWAKGLRRLLTQRHGGVPPEGSFLARMVATD